jgi:hypothetical protein
MTEQQIFDNNKAIALFLGWYESPYPIAVNKVYRRDASGKEWGMPIDQLRYHLSWNQLIPFAKKLVFDTTVDSRRYDDE